MKKIHSFDIVGDGQKLFRLILKAVSNPLQNVEIGPFVQKLFGDDPDLLAIAVTLLDNEVSFCTFGNDVLAEEIVSLTMASRETCENADFIFVKEEADLKNAVAQAKCGTLADPHKSATIVVKIPEDHDTYLTMTGPGIDGSVSISTSDVVRKAILWRDEMYFEYPQGVDFLFVNPEGEVFAIPRLVKKEV